MNLFADVVPESRANLNRDAFAASATAEQMRKPCAYCNHRDHAQWNFAFFAKGDPFTYDDFTPEQIEDIKRPATEAAALANEAAGHAEQAAGGANDAAAAANEKAGYAQTQGDYAKQKADEIEDAKGSFPNLNARLNNMQSDIDNRLECITNEEFNTIFD